MISDLSLPFAAPIVTGTRESSSGFTGNFEGPISRHGGHLGPGRGHDTVFVGGASGAEADGWRFGCSSVEIMKLLILRPKLLRLRPKLLTLGWD